MMHERRKLQSNGIKEGKQGLLQTGIKQSLYNGGREANPLTVGVVSMYFRSTTDFRLKCCKMDVRNINNSMRARPSPKQIRFPANEKHRIDPFLV